MIQDRPDSTGDIVERPSGLPPDLSAWTTPDTHTKGLDLRFVPPALFSLPKWLQTTLVHLLGIDRLLPVFHSISPELPAGEFSAAGLRTMGITLETDADLAAKIPATGPLVIVCNHPFGGLDGLALMAALLPHRPDMKVLVNIILGIFPTLRTACLPLDVLSGKRESVKRNIATLRQAGAHVQSGGAVAFFPSGTVSHWQRGKGISDPEWQLNVARFAIRHNAPVLPIFFHGRNSLFFNFMGTIHPLLRTVLLPRETLQKYGSTIRMSVGRLIEPGTMNKLLVTPEAITAYLRMRCYALQHVTNIQESVPPRPMEPVADPYPPDVVADAFTKLPSECFLLREGDYALYAVHAGQSPILLEELGALREHTFRLVGEGSGKARDLDIYDERYHHLLLWNEKDRCLVGAYRLGKVREILVEHGPAGLYTTTLFRMSKEFFRRYGDALELGRAVVHPRYQREYAPLMLLWKGIGAFLLRHEELRCLFGPVSLSLDYAPTSLRTVMEYLREQCGDAELASMVCGRNLPDKLLRFSSALPLSQSLGYNDIVALVRDIEGGRGIPILFKHYLKLGGKIGAFHMDTAFNTLDAFLLMDLANSPRKMLERYMTPEGATTFLSRWKV